MAGHIVLAGGQKNGVGAADFAAAKVRGPIGTGPFSTLQRIHAAAAQNRGSGLRGQRQQRFVEGTAAERERGKRQVAGCNAPPRRKTDAVDGQGAESAEIEAQRLEISNCFAAEEFAADFVMRNCRLLDQFNRPSAARHSKGECRARRAAADDQGFPMAATATIHRFTREMQSRPGHAEKISIEVWLRPASAIYRRQSSRVKLR